MRRSGVRTLLHFCNNLVRRENQNPRELANVDKNGARKRQYLITQINLKDSDVTKGTTISPDWNGIKIGIAKKKRLVSFLLFALLPPYARPRMENRHDPLPPRPAVTFLQLRPAVPAVRESGELEEVGVQKQQSKVNVGGGG